jgi:hypothetical protein
MMGAGDSLCEMTFVFGLRHFKYRELLKSFPSQEDIIMDDAVRPYESEIRAYSPTPIPARAPCHRCQPPLSL